MRDEPARRGGFFSGVLVGLLASIALAVALALLSPLEREGLAPGAPDAETSEPDASAPETEPPAPVRPATDSEPGTPAAPAEATTPTPTEPTPAEPTPAEPTPAEPIPDAAAPDATDPETAAPETATPDTGPPADDGTTDSADEPPITGPIIEPAAPPTPDPDPQGSVTPEAPEASLAALGEAELPQPPSIAGTQNPEPVIVANAPPTAGPTLRAPADETAPVARRPDMRPLLAGVSLAAPPPPDAAPRDAVPEAGPAAEKPPRPDPATLPPAPIPEAPAWQSYAARGTDPAPGPLLAILLELPRGAKIDPDRLAGLRLPLSFVLRTDDPEAGRIAREMRAAGFEVFLTPSGDEALIEGLDPAEVETRLEHAFRLVPEVVGIADIGGRLGRDADLATSTVRALMRRGHAVVTEEAEARNVMLRIAPDQGIRHMIAGRRLDADPAPRAILTALDRAAFTARNEGTAVAIAEMRAETVQAIVAWAVSGTNRQVRLVPGSAVLARAGGS